MLARNNATFEPSWDAKRDKPGAPKGHPKGKPKGRGRGTYVQHDRAHHSRFGPPQHPRQGLGGGTCKHCQRNITTAHTEWDCWYNPKNMNPMAVAKRAAKAKAKPGKGKDGKGSGKNIRALEEQDWQEDQSQ